MNARDAHNVAVAGAVVLAVGGAGWLIWSARKGLQDLFKGTGGVLGSAAQVAQDLAQAAQNITGAVSDVTGAVTAPFDTTKGANMGAAKKEEFKPAQLQLQIKLVDKDVDKSTLNVKKTVTLEVVDQAGNRVPHAELAGVPNTAMGRRLLGNKIVRVTDSRGRATVFWTIRRVLSGADNDVTWTARKDGYNPSPGLTT